MTADAERTDAQASPASSRHTPAALRAVGALIPLWVAVVLLGALVAQWYTGGRHFHFGLKVVGVGVDFMAAAPLVMVILLVWAVVLRRMWSPLTRRTKAAIFALDLLSIAAVLVSPLVGSLAFRIGRNQAYRAIDYAALAREGAPLAAQAAASPGDTLLIRAGHVPPYMASLSPLDVIAAPHAVAVELDGGGIAPVEGVVISFGKTLRTTGAVSLRLLNEDPPVYEFHCEASDVAAMIGDRTATSPAAPAGS